jgi:hypothetical protein
MAVVRKAIEVLDKNKEYWKATFQALPSNYRLVADTNGALLKK